MPASNFHLRLKRTPIFVLIFMLSGFFIGCSEKKENVEPAAADVTVSVPQRPKRSVHFEIGDIIKEDQLLLIIDHEPFKAAVENARDGAVKQKAQLERAEIDYNRNLALLNHAHEFIYDDSDAAPLPPVDYGQQ